MCEIRNQGPGQFRIECLKSRLKLRAKKGTSNIEISLNEDFFGRFCTESNCIVKCEDSDEGEFSDNEVFSAEEVASCQNRTNA